ncbi:MFS transporter [Listeria costaricensis]|uniref:MFS transporter n=1 Tax=Listeria costaricensis TaxID=2026604 RepID=UPI000C079891|nr:MFS transporter [Listeria costaricensis]
MKNMENVSKSQKIPTSLLIFIIGVFMAALDNGIISAALTTINQSFQVSATEGAWGITLYTLGMAVSTPIVGKLADRYGRKKLFLIEILIFGLGSLLVALSPSFTFFLTARLIQSFGGGGIFIIASSHVLSTMPKERQGSLLGILGAMNGIASVLGPNIGSFLLDWTGSWHWLFLINVPIALLLLIFGLIVIPETKGNVLSKTDFWGIVFLSTAILSIMFAITNLGSDDLLGSFLSLKVLGLLILGILLFVILILIEKSNPKRNVDSILPFSLLRQKAYLLTLLMGFLSGTLIAAVIFVPSFVQAVLGVTAANSGYWMTPLALAAGVGASMGGIFVDKQGPVKTLVYASIVAVIGFGWLAYFADTKPLFIAASIVAGIGFGFLIGAPLSVLASNAAGEEKGSALGTLSVARQIGLTIAPTIYATLIQNGFGQLKTIIPEKLQQNGISPQDIPASEWQKFSSSTGNMNDLASQIDKIPVPQIQSALESAIHQAAEIAYQHVFLTASIMAFLILPLAFFLWRALRKEK